MWIHSLIEIKTFFYTFLRVHLFRKNFIFYSKTRQKETERVMCKKKKISRILVHITKFIFNFHLLKSFSSCVLWVEFENYYWVNELEVIQWLSKRKMNFIYNMKFQRNTKKNHEDWRFWTEFNFKPLELYLETFVQKINIKFHWYVVDFFLPHSQWISLETHRFWLFSSNVSSIFKLSIQFEVEVDFSSSRFTLKTG